mmetsp:Transcript_31995/g.41124  ORF Transcript_31995/g.41124 Transcript_31995/m.41124 type:complete len:437 (-) Transcript_31995:227-1537(-)|eukprot:CAMPEP_0114351020 /NCGR_PEP_ID=MMETSP0101-20121206/16843_1 /TAXON_ID=38822 ORGANISM="Pteridomonas danica, Strain PT" /NCGR_SAMPLE_ID=MMETSP0101 /ASSEMBLY_ACC=CAM_ASM_000211 /LENGTH=436 /DNA_ID=CAMNT_0001490633 /DNA_START=26 /DNA_END=1336 /DNA_ORIENTATION=-
MLRINQTFRRDHSHILRCFSDLSASKQDKKNDNNNGIDPRVWPIATSTFITGSAIGVALPVMPLFAAELGLSTAEFGLVGSTFGAARLLSNPPLALLSEHVGRRQFLTWGPGITALSMVGTGLSGSLTALLGWRVLSGVGGSMQMTGGQLYLSDISKPENRARTMAPMTAAFSAGASIGPAIGGVLATQFGIAPCFYYVGGAIAVTGMMNFFLLPETKSHSEEDGVKNKSISETWQTWVRLSKDKNVRLIMLSHVAHWCTISGSQFTLMPLLASQELGMTPAGIGSIFAMVSAINVVGSQLSAQVSDRFGRRLTIIPGLSLITVAVGCVPLVQDGTQLTALMACWAVGSAFVSTGPTAYMLDVVAPGDRDQALAMLRACGDMGLLIGAGSLGSLAHATSMQTGFWVNSIGMAVTTLNIALNATEPKREVTEQTKLK